jgi:hypothetical protein
VSTAQQNRTQCDRADQTAERTRFRGPCADVFIQVECIDQEAGVVGRADHDTADISISAFYANILLRQYKEQRYREQEGIGKANNMARKCRMPEWYTS